MLPDNAPMHSRHSGYLKLSFISMCINYVFNIDSTTGYISSIASCLLQLEYDR